MTKTMSIRMDEENFEFLSGLTKDEQTDLSKAVRDLVTRGRILLAIEKYRDGEVSLSKAAELAGMRVGQMMKTLADFGVESRIEQDDYLQGLANLKKAW
jgi:predicted HTH domain antitoxin